MTDLNERLARLSPEKRALLMQQLNKQLPKSNSNEIGKRERPARIPLSFAQQRLWIMDQLEPNSATYNVPHAMWMNGQPDFEIIERVLTEIVNRHEVMRTQIRSDEQGPFQWVAEPQTIKLGKYDLSQLALSERQAEAYKLALSEAARPFDIAKGPLLRAAVVSVNKDRHLFLLNAHHIAVDGWSYSVIFHEFAELYKAFLQGANSPLEPLTTQYIDYTLWQQELLAEGSKTLEKQLAYWQETLSGNLPVLELPGDRPRPPVQSNRGDVFCFPVSAKTYSEFKNLAQQHKVTVFMAFAAAFQTLLYRYSGQQDIILGVGVANRRLQELESLVGFFVNTLALRIDLSGDPSFQDLLARVKDTMLGADAHQDLPVERLLEVLDVERALSHSPLFQVMLFFQNFPSQNIDLPGLTLSPVDNGKIHAGVARNDLALFASESDGGLLLYFEYATDLFDSETIQAMAENLNQLLESVVVNPAQKLSEVNILPAQESQKLLKDWNATERLLPDSLSIDQLFDAQVERSPNATAVRHLDNELTYLQLQDRANNLATLLLENGVKTGDLVGLLVNRSANMLVGLLGILKAGAGYVPLDPNYPIDRITFMLEDSNVATVVTEPSLLNTLPDIELQALLIDAVPQNNAAQPLPQNVTAESVAYVIFTSGTTGRPKGVLIPHAAVTNFLMSMAQQPGMNEDDIVCAITTLSFDIAVLELLLPLIVGAKIELADSSVVADGVALANLINRSAVTFIQATPTTWQLLLNSEWHGSSSLKLLSGGEPLSRELADRLLACSSELWNMYGPTETTIWSTVERVEPGKKAITVGKPIANTQVYILDKNRQLVPTGVPGELYIGGRGVALGYLDREQLTVEKFVANPFLNSLYSDLSSNNKLYRTGDLAKWSRDGRIEIIGRIDHQVKLRGFRIELGEIESVLNEHCDIKQSIVLCREDRPGDKRLVAYITGLVSESEMPACIDSIRAFAKLRLPDYMVPSAYVSMEKFPLTPNGKIDRLSLPLPEIEAAVTEAYTAPRNEDEASLLSLWSAALGLPQIGIHDDFFKLGGHSLLATQLISKIRNSFGINVSLRNLFESPTVAEFAEFIANERLANIDESALAGMLDQLENLSEEALESLLANEGACS